MDLTHAVDVRSGLFARHLRLQQLGVERRTHSYAFRQLGLRRDAKFHIADAATAYALEKARVKHMEKHYHVFSTYLNGLHGRLRGASVAPLQVVSVAHLVCLDGPELLRLVGEEKVVENAIPRVTRYM